MVNKSKMKARFVEQFDESAILRLCYESRCKNIVEVIESFEDSDSYYIV